jgi:formamidopyrimidine-DNA glycosylase
MIELPESHVLAEQFRGKLTGKTIVSAVADTHHHGFAFYFGDPALYGQMLTGKRITGSVAYGGLPELWAEDMRISLYDGAHTRYLEPGEKRPVKHQFLTEFDDGSAIYCTVQMYGGILAYEDGARDEDMYYRAAKDKPSPYTEDFNRSYFELLLKSTKPNLSAKAFLATEQRIPGLGNGVLQDILWHAKIHPKRKLNTLTSEDTDKLFDSVKTTLLSMREQGGRDNEKDLFNRAGGYRTILSSKTLAYPCPACGGGIVREAYLGGNVYYCPTCQLTVDR